MVVCHQPYSEAKQIPFDEVLQYQYIFEDLLKSLFGKTPTNQISKALSEIKRPPEWDKLLRSDINGRS